MITFTCASCQKELSVKNELAGKKGKCPACGAAVAVPNSAAASKLVSAVNSPPEEMTILPQQRGVAGHESLSESSGRTTSGVRRQEAGARQPSAAGPAPELWDFLAPAEAPDELGRLGPYRVLKVLGSGGMGVVFQAEDPQLKRQVALKAMLPVLAASASAKQRFLREAQTVAAIEHDHIVAIHQVGEDRGVPFIAMPLLKGEPLDERLQRAAALPVAEVLRIGREAAKGLGAAHAAGLVHRDIKPANLWLEGEEGRVKILDFGLARATADNAQLTQQGAIVGTPAYMAPEQATGQVVDCRCDLFSLGCVLYRLCTGRPPFEGTDTVSTLMAVATEDPTPPAELRPELPLALSDLVMRLLAKKPAERPESARDVVKALEDIERDPFPTTARRAAKTRTRKGGGTAPIAPARPSRQRRAKQGARLPWLVAAGVLGLGVLATAIVVLWPTPRGTVRIESNDPSVEIAFDKTGPTVKGADKEPIVLRAGEHGVRIKRGDFAFEADKFVLRKGETIALQVELLKGKIRVTADGQVIGEADLPRSDVADATRANPLRPNVTKDPGAANERPAPTPAKPEKLGTAADRAAADWILGVGGGVTLTSNDGGSPVQVLPQLYGGFALSSDDNSYYEAVGKLADARKGVYAQPTFVLNHANLWGRKVSDGDLQRLKGLQGLRTLNLGYTAVSNRGLDHLRELPSLTLLRLNNTAVDAEGVRRLRQALPKCVIATEPAISYAKLAAGAWTPVLNKEEDFKGEPNVKLANGTVQLTGHEVIFAHAARWQDMAIRARIKKLDAHNMGLRLRSKAVRLGYIAYFDGGRVFGFGMYKNRFINFMGITTPVEYKDFFELTFAADGDTLAVFVDGKQIMEYRDPNPEAGDAGIAVFNGAGQFKQIAVSRLR